MGKMCIRDSTGLAFHISMKAQVILPAGAARIEPEELAAILESPEADNYLILNTGPVNDIKNAVNIGACLLYTSRSG